MKNDTATIIALFVSAVFFVIAYLVAKVLWDLFVSVLVPLVLALLATYFFYYWFKKTMLKKS